MKNEASATNGMTSLITKTVREEEPPATALLRNQSNTNLSEGSGSIKTLGATQKVPKRPAESVSSSMYLNERQRSVDETQERQQTVITRVSI